MDKTRLIRDSAQSKFVNSDYGRLVRFYDFLDTLNYGNVSRRSRNAFLGALPFVPRSPIIAACGTGDYARAFVRVEKPDRLAINDLSPKMAEMTAIRIRETGWAGKLDVLVGDITGFTRSNTYDFVSLNYLLSIFGPSVRKEFLRRVMDILQPGGILQVADFARPKNLIWLPFFYLNWVIVCLAFWILCSNKPNRLGDMEAQFRDAGLIVLKKKTYVCGLFASYLLQKR